MHNLSVINSWNNHYQSNRSLSSCNLHHIDPLLKADRNANKEQRKRKEIRLKINASGQIYETYESTLNRYPETLLGTREKRKLLTDPYTGVIFLNRHRASFEAILFFYQSTGNLVRPQSIQMSDFVEECEYYQLPENAVKRMKHRECFLYVKKRVQSQAFLKSFRCTLWKFLEKPTCKHKCAYVYFHISYAVILLSIVLYCAQTEIILHPDTYDLKEFQTIYRSLEIGINIFFAFEFAIRFFVSPYRKCFLLEPVNMFEFISLGCFLTVCGFDDSKPFEGVKRLARILYIFRITRLGRISKIVNISFTVFQEAVNDVIAVVFTLIIVTIFGGTVMYYFEDMPKTDFTSIPQSMWWALQTSICLGYGDIVPQTFFGRYIGSFVLYGGVVVVMILILSLGGRVFDMYIKEFDENSSGFLPDGSEVKEDYEIHY